MTPREIAQQILDGPWVHASAALRACQRGEWAEFVRASASKKPWLWGWFAYLRCCALAERTFAGPDVTQATLVPLWACGTAETVSTEWVAVHGVVRDRKPMEVLEMGPFIALDDASPSADAVWECTVKRWKVGIVVDGYVYGPGIPLLLRAGGFGVLELEIYEVIDVLAREGEAQSRPRREVPIFASWFAPRVTVSPELESQISAMCLTSGTEEERASLAHEEA
jgi:hypothetical protein